MRARNRTLLGLALTLALTVSGCGWMREMSSIRKSVEAKGYDVDKVAMKKASGTKTVTVYLVKGTDDAGKKEITEIVKTIAPETNQVVVRKATPESKPRDSSDATPRSSSSSR